MPARVDGTGGLCRDANSAAPVPAPINRTIRFGLETWIATSTILARVVPSVDNAVRDDSHLGSSQAHVGRIRAKEASAPF
jgi:hypothetical protein